MSITPEVSGLRLALGVSWRCFPDGIVVYVAETCETHLLSCQFKSLLEAGESGLTPGIAEYRSPGDFSGESTFLSADVAVNGLDQLLALRIVRRIN